MDNNPAQTISSIVPQENNQPNNQLGNVPYWMRGLNTPDATPTTESTQPEESVTDITQETVPVAPIQTQPEVIETPLPVAQEQNPAPGNIKEENLPKEAAGETAGEQDTPPGSDSITSLANDLESDFRKNLTAHGNK